MVTKIRKNSSLWQVNWTSFAKLWNVPLFWSTLTMVWTHLCVHYRDGKRYDTFRILVKLQNVNFHLTRRLKIFYLILMYSRRLLKKGKVRTSKHCLKHQRMETATGNITLFSWCKPHNQKYVRFQFCLTLWWNITWNRESKSKNNMLCVAFATRDKNRYE